MVAGYLILSIMFGGICLWVCLNIAKSRAPEGMIRARKFRQRMIGLGTLAENPKAIRFYSTMLAIVPGLLSFWLFVAAVDALVR